LNSPIVVLAEIQQDKEKLFVHPKLVQLMIHESNEFDSYKA